MTKVLTVVGRAERRSEFERNLNSYLTENFKIQAIIPLAADGNLKNFLAYVEAEDETDEEAVEIMAEILVDMTYAAVAHDSPDDATEFASEEYGEQARSSPFMTPITSEEIFLHNVLVALMGAGETLMLRGLLDGVPVGVFVHDAVGHKRGDRTMTPLAILVDKELGKRIELPLRSVYDEET